MPTMRGDSRTRGPLTIPRSPQGRPVLMQAGSSPRGRDFAARWAEAIFNSSGSTKDAIEFYATSRGGCLRSAARRRSARCCTSMTVVLGETESIAREKAGVPDFAGAVGDGAGDELGDAGG